MGAPSSSNINSRSVQDTYAEGLLYFEGQGALNSTLARLSKDLDKHGIEYMVIGAIALVAHGYLRFTEGIDLVLTGEGLAKFNRELLGVGGYGLAGYTRQFPGSTKSLRSIPEGVSIEVMTTGEYPGDGKPKPVSIPRPSEASIEHDGIRFITLEKLIELKLASGMAAPDRLKDLADVQELIKIRGFGIDFADRLDAHIREKFVELAQAVENSRQENREHS